LVTPVATCISTMALVNYSDSESEDRDDKKDVKNGVEKPTPNLKRKRVDEAPSTSAPASALPPLPVAFHDLYATNVRVGVKDDPALHGGRKRSTPHVGGNWPTHVYLECTYTL
jgi:U6 snRNA phosphodiesterase